MKKATKKTTKALQKLLGAAAAEELEPIEGIRPELGDLARDIVTGYTGIVMAKTQWLNGCIRITIQNQSVDKDGCPAEPATFDIDQLVVLKENALQKKEPMTGGPCDDRAALRR